MVGVALEFRAAKLEQGFVILVKNQAVLRPVDAKLMDRRAHLGGEGEIGSSSLLLADDNAKLVYNLGFSDAFEKRAHKSVGDDLGIIARQEFCNSGNSVADNVVEQPAR